VTSVCLYLASEYNIVPIIHRVQNFILVYYPKLVVLVQLLLSHVPTARAAEIMSLSV